MLRGLMSTVRLVVISFCLLELAALQATVFGTVRGVVHDAQHLPIPGVTVTLKAQDSDWVQIQKKATGENLNLTPSPLATTRLRSRRKDSSNRNNR